MKDIKIIKNGVRLILGIILAIHLNACAASEGSGDEPSAAASSASPVSMYDNTTPLGQMVQSNGYSFNASSLDQSFLDTKQCLGVTTSVPSDIYVELKEPYSAFPCVPLPNGCGGLFDLDNGEPVITVTADMVRLKHEYIHYMLYYTTGDPDSGHTTNNFDRCA